MSLSKVRKAILTQFTEVDLTHNPFGVFFLQCFVNHRRGYGRLFIVCIKRLEKEAFFYFFNAMLMGCDTKYET